MRARCMRWSSGSASATATCRKARSAATPTSRCASPADKLGTRCEIKNLNSFRFMERAIEFEARRQIELLEDGGPVEQETRLYDPERDETRSMRTKEDAQDYRYFPDPDLLPLVVKEEEIERLKRELPELPDAKRERFVREYRLPAYDAALITASRAAAEFFEQLVRLAGAEPKICANWQTGELRPRSTGRTCKSKPRASTPPRLRRC